MKRFNFLGELLRRSRQTKKLSQGKLAKKLGCHVQFVSNWERGLCEPPTPLRKKALKALAVNSKDFMNAIHKDAIEVNKMRAKEYGLS